VSTWDNVGWDRIEDEAAWAAPLVRAHFSPQLRAELLQLCADRHQMLKLATRLPQTICHHDVWPSNVFHSSDHTTLVDWAFAGYGHVGADPGNLVTDSCGDLLQPAALLP
jgi:Ser/Thr protein kinase RdoA (MazF antagonist)